MDPIVLTIVSTIALFIAYHTGRFFGFLHGAQHAIEDLESNLLGAGIEELLVNDETGEVTILYVDGREVKL